MQIAFEAEVWRWDARREDWFFVSVPETFSEDIAEIIAIPRGFGSVRVQATIGSTTWRTSIFPSVDPISSGKAYVLPLKRAVREAEALEPSCECAVTLQILDA